MNKFGKIGLITAGALVALVGGGAILYNTVPSLKNTGTNNQANIGLGGGIGDITINTDNTNKQYLALINQYSKQIDDLKTQLNNNKAESESKIAEMQAEIDALQLELENTQESDADIIAEKNARIQSLKQYIKTLESENAEIVASYEDEISDLNTLISNYEKEIIATIKLPTDFTFTSLGFRVVEGNDFVFYSTSHSCKLYYYHFNSKTLETINIKGTSFDSFKKHEDKLYFRTSKISYVYDFLNKTLDILGSANGLISYIADNANMYLFDYSGGYAIHNFLTGSFTNFLGDGVDSSTSVTIKKIDGYILHTAYNITDTNKSKHHHIRCFNTDTMTDSVLFDTSSTLTSFLKTSHGYYMTMSTGLYKLNIETLQPELIQPLESTTHYGHVLEDKVVVFGYYGAYVYDGSMVTELTTYTKLSVNPKYLKISDGLYYVFSTSSTFSGIWKLDLNMNNLVQISEAYTTYADRLTIDHYEFVMMQSGIYVIDLDTGAVDTMSLSNTQYTSKFNVVEDENYTFFYVSNANTKASYIYYYDKVNDMYGKIYNGKSFTITECMVKNGVLYIMVDSYLYGFNINASLDNYVTYLTINSALSNLQAGVFYAQVGTIEDGKLYIKYTLQEDNSFNKEMVIM